MRGVHVLPSWVTLAIVVLSVFSCVWGLSEPDPSDWESWLSRFGHDDYVYPQWIAERIDACVCTVIDVIPAPFPPIEEGDSLLPVLVYKCSSTHPEEANFSYTASNKSISINTTTSERAPATYPPLSSCFAREWLLSRMPGPDHHSLPPSISVRSRSLLDDTIAFTMMADRSATWSRHTPLSARLAYLLPWTVLREPVSSWRPLYFARFFSLVASARSTREAMARLVAPGWSPESHNAFTAVFSRVWPDYGVDSKVNAGARVQWQSSTAPPVLGPFEATAYGYGSCSAHALLLVAAARAVGIPARVVGTPCWDSTPFAGKAQVNPKVLQCYRGGTDDDDDDNSSQDNGDSADSGNQGGRRGRWGGKYLNNHNWVEYWDTTESRWVFVNSPPGRDEGVVDGGLCQWDREHGCGWNAATGTCPAPSSGGPASAGLDHPILAPTWSLPGDCEPSDEAASRCAPTARAPPPAAALLAAGMGTRLHAEGGNITDARDFVLSDGSKVSPLVWASAASSPSGGAPHRQGMRIVNRTDHYRCKP